MTNRILKGVQAEYNRLTLADAKDPGIEPFGDNILVLMDSTVTQSSGGIHLPEHIVGQMNLASESGVLVALGGAAFSRHGDGSAWDGAKPVPGDRLFVERYAGRLVQGRDGQVYRIMTYTCVAGREVAEASAKSKKKG